MNLQTLDDLLQRIRRRPVRTALLLLVLLATVAFVAWVNAYSSEIGKRAAVRTTKGQQAVTPAISLDRMLVSVNDEATRLELTIRNRRREEALINTVSLLLERETSDACYQRSSHTIRFSDEVSVEFSQKTGSLSGSFEMESDPSFRYAAQGTLSRGCGGDLSVNLDMATAIALPSASLTQLNIVLPRVLNVGFPVPAARRGRVGLGISELDFSNFTEMSATLVTERGDVARSTYEIDALPKRALPRRVPAR